MIKKLIALVVLALVLTTFVSYSFAQCGLDKQIKDQKVACCQCCSCYNCCKCAK